MANQITVNSGTGNITVTTSRSVIGTVANVATANYANFAGDAFNVDLANVNGIGNIASVNLDGNVANALLGDGTFGPVELTTANYANFAGNVLNAAQPNITSVGNLVGLTSTGNITAPYFLGNIVGNISGNIVVPGFQGDVLFNNAGNAGANSNFNYDDANSTLNITGNLNATNISGDGTGLSNITGANVTGSVANATYANDAGNANIANIAYSVDVANVSNIGNIATINLDGNVSNALLGDGTFGPVELTTAATVTANAQPNITSVGTLVSLTTQSNANTTIESVDNSVFLRVTNNSNVAGTTVQQQHFNNVTQQAVTAGAAEAGFSVTIANTAPGNVIPGNLKGLWRFTTTGNLDHIFGGTGNLNAKGIGLGSGNITVGNVNASFLYGNGSGISAINGSNVTGTVANATYANDAGNANIANIAYSVDGANVSGTVANATYADSANLSTYANIVVDNAQPNITSVGTLTGLTTLSNTNTLLESVDSSVLLRVTNNANTAGTTVQQQHFNNVTQQAVTAGASETGFNISIANTAPGNVIPGNLKGVWRFNSSGNLDHIFGGSGSINAKGIGLGSGNITVGNVNASFLYGNGSGISAINGSNVTGTVGNATYANIVIDNSQPNITSVGTLTGLDVNGAINAINGVYSGTNGGALQTNIDNVVNCPDITFNRFDNNSYITNYSVYRARGTVSSPSAVQTGDSLFQIYNSAYSNVGFEYAATGSYATVVNTNDGAGNITISSQYGAAIPSGSDFNINYGLFNTYGDVNIGTGGTGNISVANGQIDVGSGNVIIAQNGDVATLGNVDVGNGNILLNNDGRIDYLRTFGSFTSNATQTSNGANTTNYMTFNNTEDANGISITNSTEITVARTGRYNIQFSAQLEKTDSGTDLVEIWLVKNGNGVANSATQLTLTGNGAKDVAAWDFNVDAANVNDYFEIAWASPDTNVQLTAIDTANTISGVAVPSIILDINPVGA